jgi:hypothetical protein
MQIKGRWFASLALVGLAGLPSAALGRDHNVDCNAEYKFSQSKLSLSADILKKVTLSVSSDPQLLAQVDKWTTVVLTQQRALCDAYKASSEQNFPTALYLQKLDDLQQWEIDFFKAILAYQNTTDAATKGTKGGDEIGKMKKDVESQLKSILNNEPNLTYPGKKTTP